MKSRLSIACLPLLLWSESDVLADTSASLVGPDDTRAAEWLSADFGLGLAGIEPGLGSAVRIGTFRWRRFAWTVLDVSILSSVSDFIKGSSEPCEEGHFCADTGLLNVATRAYYSLDRDAIGKKQYWFGFGPGVLFAAGESGMNGPRNTPAMLSLSPSFDYTIQYNPMLTVGLGFRVVVGVGERFTSDRVPFLALASFRVGFTPGNVVRRAFQERPSGTTESDGESY